MHLTEKEAAIVRDAIQNAIPILRVLTHGGSWEAGSPAATEAKLNTALFLLKEEE